MKEDGGWLSCKFLTITDLFLIGIALLNICVCVLIKSF